MGDVADNARPALWRNVSFHLLWSSTFASGVGDRLIMNAALPMLGYGPESGENASIQAGIQFFFFLPYLLWSPFAGWLSDKLPRKWIMFAADELRGLILIWAFLIVPAGVGIVPADQQWQVWAVILVVGVMAATFVPAKLSIVPNVVGLDMLPRANAAVVSMGIIGNLIGFIVGGIIVEHSVRAMILTGAGAYMVSGCFWVFLKTPWRQRTGAALTRPIRDIRAGIRYAMSHRPVRVLIFTVAAVWGGVAIYMPALAVVNVELYGRSAAGFMFVAAPVGLGMLIAAFGLGVCNPRFGSELLIALGLALCGVFIGLQMIVPVFGLGVVIALLTGLGAGVLLVPLNTMLQRCSADHIRGRVFAAKEIIQEFGQVVISGTIWWLGAAADPWMRPASGVMAIGLVAMAVGGLFMFILTGPAPTRGMNLLWRLVRVYTEVVHRLEVRGRHHVPRDGPVLLVSNHTAGLDPALIQAAVPRVVTWMMAREYMTGRLGWLWKMIQPIGVRRTAADPAAAKQAIAILRDGGIVGIFPEGRINRQRDGLYEFGDGAAMIARRGEARVVAVFIDGTPNTRTAMGSYARPSRSRVTFGEPFDPFESCETDEAAARFIREQVRRLA